MYILKTKHNSSGKSHCGITTGCCDVTGVITGGEAVVFSVDVNKLNGFPAAIKLKFCVIKLARENVSVAVDVVGDDITES